MVQKIILNIWILIFGIMFALAVAAATAPPAVAQEVHFLPPQSSASYCNTTEVEIWVNATSFQSGQIVLTYNPSCANVTDWVGNTTNFPMGGWIHTEDGNDRIYFVGSALKTGEYMIGMLTIHCVNESGEGCVTTLNFTGESKLFDDYGSIPANWIDGTFECAPPEEGEFDTGAPPNPYPSIFGTHNGTLTPSHDIIADKMFTYPCAGTGGHTEYVKIWNDTWQEGIETHWQGYQAQVADYHVIIFPQQFTLFANQKYNYTIRTGSYPQIWHTDRLETGTEDGVIECSEFVDANGRSYSNWIPAFRLFS